MLDTAGAVISEGIVSTRHFIGSVPIERTRAFLWMLSTPIERVSGFAAHDAVRVLGTAVIPIECDIGFGGGERSRSVVVPTFRILSLG